MNTLIKTLLMTIMVTTVSCQTKETLFVVSGYTTDGKPDVALCKLTDDDALTIASGIVISDNPSFIAVGEKNKIYVANEVDTFNMASGGGITTLQVDLGNKKLEKAGSINQGGGGPCHIMVSDDRRHLITANYGSGSVSVVRLNEEKIPERVTDVIFFGEKSHPHMTLYNSRTRLYYVSDLGLDRIHIFRLDTVSGRLVTANVPFIASEAGSGPRHMAIDRAGRNLYVINELNSTISVFDILPLTPVIKQTVSTLPADFTGKSYCADIHLSGNGRELYGSNRGHNSIVTFTVGSDGTLSSAKYKSCGGDWPRNFAVSPSGQSFLVANQRSNEISMVSTGNNNSVESVMSLPFNAPACVKSIK
jgi:6-phosphogluconolactonase